GLVHTIGNALMVTAPTLTNYVALLSRRAAPPVRRHGETALHHVATEHPARGRWLGRGDPLCGHSRGLHHRSPAAARLPVVAPSHPRHLPHPADHPLRAALPDGAPARPRRPSPAARARLSHDGAPLLRVDPLHLFSASAARGRGGGADRGREPPGRIPLDR